MVQQIGENLYFLKLNVSDDNKEDSEREGDDDDEHHHEHHDEDHEDTNLEIEEVDEK